MHRTNRSVLPVIWSKPQIHEHEWSVNKVKVVGFSYLVPLKVCPRWYQENGNEVNLLIVVSRVQQSFTVSVDSGSNKTSKFGNVEIPVNEAQQLTY